MSSLHYTLNHEPYPKLEELDPGLRATEYCVVILKPIISDRQGSIYIPPDAKTREQEAGDEGLLVQVSPMAFPEQDFPFRDCVPQVGEVVTFTRYAGKSYVGADGRVYTIMKDKEINGIREKAAGDPRKVGLKPVADTGEFRVRSSLAS